MRCIIALSLLTTVFIAQTRLVEATPPSPLRDYVVETANGEYVLVLLVPDAMGEPDTPSPEIRAKYPRSGLYTQSGILVWTLDWYLPPGSSTVDEWITLLDDGEHLITWAQPWPMKDVGETTCDNIELGFYKRGKELKSYRVNEMVTCPGRLPQYEGGYFWRASYSVNQETRMLRVHTNDGQSLDFDITTGEIAGTNTGTPGWRYFFLAIVGIIAMSVLAVIGLRTWSKRKKRT